MAGVLCLPFGAWVPVGSVTQGFTLGYYILHLRRSKAVSGMSTPPPGTTPSRLPEKERRRLGGRLARGSACFQRAGFGFQPGPEGGHARFHYPQLPPARRAIKESRKANRSGAFQSPVCPDPSGRCAIATCVASGLRKAPLRFVARIRRGYPHTSLPSRSLK